MLHLGSLSPDFYFFVKIHLTYSIRVLCLARKTPTTYPQPTVQYVGTAISKWAIVYVPPGVRLDILAK